MLRKDTTGVSSLKTGNATLTSSEAKVNTLNTQFYSVFTQEDSVIPPMPPSTYPNIGIVIFSVEGIQALLVKLQPKKSCGPDDIPSWLLKECADEIAPILQIIFTQSLNTHTLPQDWLTANITPVFKKGDRSKPSNYRPISLTSICCKTMEHIVFSFIMNHSDCNSIINSYQHGFRPHHSCETQLLPFVEDISRAMDQHSQIDLLLLDFSKAFDTVPHMRLLSKLSYYGINGPLHEWISSRLTQRTQKVVLNGVASKEVKVISGVPQGTVLGPLLFLLYVNDINDNINSTIRMFADDCVLYRIIKTLNDHHHLQNDLDIIIQWAIKWQMNLNADKSAVLHCTRSRSPYLIDYFTNGKPLPTHEQHQYLRRSSNTPITFMVRAHSQYHQ